MAINGELLQKKTLPPHMEMRVLLGTARSAVVLALNHQKKDKLARMLGNTLGEDYQLACRRAAFTLQGSPFEDEAELIGSGTRLTTLEQHVAETLDKKNPTQVRDALFRTSGILYMLGETGEYDAVDHSSLDFGLGVIDAVHQALIATQANELPPKVRGGSI